MNTNDLVRLLYRHAVDMGLPVKDSWWIEPPVDAKPLDLHERLFVTSEDYLAPAGLMPAPGPVTFAVDGGYPVVFNVGAIPAPAVGAWVTIGGLCIDNAGNGYCFVSNGTPALLQQLEFRVVQFNPNTGAYINSLLLTTPGYVGAVVGFVTQFCYDADIDRATGNIHWTFTIQNVAGGSESWLGQVNANLNPITEAYAYIGFQGIGGALVEVPYGIDYDTIAGTVYIDQPDATVPNEQMTERATAGLGGALLNSFVLTPVGTNTWSPIVDNFSNQINYTDIVGGQTRWYFAPKGAWPPVPGVPGWYDGTELGQPIIAMELLGDGFEKDGYVFRSVQRSNALFCSDPTTSTLRADSRNTVVAAVRGLFFEDDPTQATKLFTAFDQGPPPWSINRWTVTYPTVAFGGGLQAVEEGCEAIGLFGVITHLSLTPVAPAASGDPVFKFDDGFDLQLGEFPTGINDPLLAVNPNEYRSLQNDDFNQPIQVRLPSPIIIPDRRVFRMLVRKFNAAVSNFNCVLTAHGWCVPEPDIGRR
jgi:hypothetical protein